MEKVRWGILGCADFVERRILPTLQDVQNGLVLALATRGESERLARLRNAYTIPRIYFSYDELLADSDIDAVYIPLPNSLHAEWTVKAALAGKHVLCEKPIACRSCDLLLIKEAAETSGVHVMEAFACLHSCLFETVHREIVSGSIGELRMVECYFCGHTPNPNLPECLPDFYGGAIHNVGCYNLLSIRQITQREPVSVKAYASYFPSGADACVNALLDMGEGLTALSVSSMISPRRRCLIATGSEGFIFYPHTPNTWGATEINVFSDGVIDPVKTILLEIPNNYAAEFTQMGRCILQGEKPLVTLEESLGNIKAMEMVHVAINSWMAKTT